MANFKQHIIGGIVTAGLSTSLAYNSFELDYSSLGVVFIIGVIGSILPDLDSDTSTPVQFLLGYLGILVPILLLNNLIDEPSMEITLLCIVGGYFFLKDVVSIVFFKLTKHRGIIHSIPVALIFGELTFLLFHDSPTPNRFMFALACVVGFLTHLALDELWSINILAGDTKRSFGTALKLKSDSWIISILTYALLVVLAFQVFQVID